MPTGSKNTEHGSRDEEAFLLADKNTRVVLVSCSAWDCASTAISGGVDISKVARCHLF